MERAKEVKLKALVRPEKELGSRASRRLRRQGWIVGVVYGKDYGPIPVKITRKDYETNLKGRWREALVRLEIEGDGVSDEQLCIVKEVQRDPITDEILNIDFMRVTAERKVRRAVRIELKGTPVGVKKGGLLQQMLREIEVEAPAGRLIHAIEAEVSHLDIGDVLTVSELPVPEGARIIYEDPNEPVAVVTPPEEEGAEEEGASPETAT